MGMNPFSKMYIPKRTVVSASNAFKSGFYLKPHNLSPHYAVIQAMHGAGALGGRTRANWVDRLNWGAESVNFQGFQLSVPWGLYEKGVNGGDLAT